MFECVPSWSAAGEQVPARRPVDIAPFGGTTRLDYLQVGHRKHAMPSQLSGGEAQRVAIARAPTGDVIPPKGSNS